MTLRRWVSGVLAAVSAGLLVLTLVWPQWIEGISGVEPDSGDGSAETVLVLGLVAVAALSSVDTVVLWRRARSRRLRLVDPDRIVER